MVIHAYDESYVNTAQSILGHAVDFAVNTIGIDPDLFGNLFSVSDVSKQFANGNSRYVTGINGCELARLVLDEAHVSYPDAEDAMFMDKSAEYWAGWALAYYQWYSSRAFSDILKAISLSAVIAMYPVFHEMDIMQFVDSMEEKIRTAFPETRLKQRRLNCGLSQSKLAKDAGVALRQIQLFEQQQRNINNASAITLLKLSKSLFCQMEDLIEYQ